ncbi:hypothetical protein AVEN_182862-1 [Araneus ventricosus]|uniref:Tc1-like transposase DDE domain-containing protein n=1 Tax=Araneus ventricosus TaxID=182803 RepID=A0A4Y2W7B1_ARAVE|nr:hypothetical protein AVEN_182862-1 [Araneus ventricosus]
MADRIDSLAKCELLSAIRFSKAESWFVEKDQFSCFLSDFTKLRRPILTSGVVLIHDNVRFHKNVVTQQLLKKFKWDVSYHPAYSPDLATSDFHLFLELKNWLADQWALTLF